MNSILKLRNSAKAKRIFILGNGPSIQDEDLSRLRGETVIGINASTLLDEKFGFVSSYYVVSDARFLNNPDKRALATHRLLPSVQRVLRGDLEESDDEGLKERSYYVPVLGKNGFSENLVRGFYFGCTTMMLALQLAYYVGGREIYLLGADFKYTKDVKRFYAEANPDPVDPFLSIQLWNIWNAKRQLAQHGIPLFLCSRSSNLAPYLDFVEFSSIRTAG